MPIPAGPGDGGLNTYATLPEFKADRRTVKTDADATLQRKLIAASRAIDRKTGRRFWLDPAPVQKTFSPRGRVLSGFDGELLLVDDIGSLDGLVVEVGSGSSWAAVTDYETQPDNALTAGEPITELLRPMSTWGVHGGGRRVRITAHWGWPEIPADITEATILLANRLNLRKDSPEGVASSGEWGAIRLSRWDPDVESLIQPYTLPGFA